MEVEKGDEGQREPGRGKEKRPKMIEETKSRGGGEGGEVVLSKSQSKE